MAINDKISWYITLARYNNEQTVIRLISGWAEHGRAFIPSMDALNTAIYIYGMYQLTDRKPYKIFIKDTGIGAALVDFLREYGLPVSVHKTEGSISSVA